MSVRESVEVSLSLSSLLTYYSFYTSPSWTQLQRAHQTTRYSNSQPQLNADLDYQQVSSSDLLRDNLIDRSGKSTGNPASHASFRSITSLAIVAVWAD